MVDQKISELTPYTTPQDTDVLPIVDTGVTTTKKITWASIKTFLATLASPTFTGVVTAPRITLPSDGQVLLTVPASTGKVTGLTTDSFQAGYSAAAWDLVFMGSGGKWLEVDSNSVTTCSGMIGLAMEAKTDGQEMLVALPGSMIRNDSWNWTLGATLYAGETLGSMQEVIPTGADAIIKVIGFPMTANCIFFNPSQDQQSTVA